MYILFCLVMQQVFLMSLIILGAQPSQGVASFRLFGLQQCEKFGKKEITGFSMTKIALYCKWRTK